MFRTARTLSLAVTLLLSSAASSAWAQQPAAPAADPVPPAPLSAEAIAASLEQGRKALAEGDVNAAYSAFNKAAASPEAQYQLGLLRQQGLGAKKDAAIACDHFERAAEGSVLAAQMRIAACHGLGIGRPKDAALAITWLERALQAEHMPALCALGDLLLSGAGGPDRIAEGRELCLEAGKRGDDSAYLLLFNAALTGRGLAKDPVAAEGYLRLAAEGDEPLPLFALAMFLDSTDAPKKSPQEVHSNLILAAGKGFVPAQFELGMRYAEAARAVDGAGLNLQRAGLAYRWLSLATARPGLDRERASRARAVLEVLTPVLPGERKAEWDAQLMAWKPGETYESAVVSFGSGGSAGP